MKIEQDVQLVEEAPLAIAYNLDQIVKQPIISCSRTEAKYRSLATIAAEITWLQHLFHDHDITLERRPLYDKQSVTYLSHNTVPHPCTKHIEIDYRFIRDKVTSGDLQLQTYLQLNKSPMYIH